MSLLFSILIIALMVGALVDIIKRDDSQVKYVPKLVWLIVVILLPLIGGLLWFGLGRDYGDGGIPIPRLRRAAGAPRPTPVDVLPAVPVDTRTTEQQIADLDREIEEWRLRQEIEQRKSDTDESGQV